VILQFRSAFCLLPREDWQYSGMANFTDKVAVVTGAGRGIGNAIARRFVDGGGRVAVISRTETNAAKAAEELNAVVPDSAKHYAVDVSDHEAVQAVGKQIIADFGKVDILVNNAGVTRDNLTMRMAEADWDLVLDTNLKGAFNTVKAFQRSILKQPGASIINISSVIGLIGNAGQANYAASKAGLIGFSKSLAREFAGRGVTVNVVAPGFIVTDMTDVLSDELKSGIQSKVPLGKLGAVDDIAGAVAFLAGADARYITGQVLTVDGGMVM
jgi:3-oxoacyl-[acyl-carrier protein] reductase